MAENKIVPSDMEVDLANRDPTNVNDYVKVLFEDTLAEPEGSHSIDGVWRCSYKTFWAMKNCCYVVLTVLCGVPLAFIWGLVFAVQSFYNIWIVRPCITSFVMDLKCYGECYRRCIECQFDPFFDSIARTFSKIKFHHTYEVV